MCETIFLNLQTKLYDTQCHLWSKEYEQNIQYLGTCKYLIRREQWIACTSSDKWEEADRIIQHLHPQKFWGTNSVTIDYKFHCNRLRIRLFRDLKKIFLPLVLGVVIKELFLHSINVTLYVYVKVSIFWSNSSGRKLPAVYENKALGWAGRKIKKEKRRCFISFKPSNDKKLLFNEL